MAVNKPTKPDSELPETWGGTQYPYTEEEVENGYLETVPQIVDGGKLNYQMKGIFERLKYTTAIADVINNTPIGQVVAVDSNNRFEYRNLPVISSDDEYSEGVSTVLSPSVKQVADSFLDVPKLNGENIFYGRNTFFDQVEFKNNGRVWNTATGNQRDTRYCCKFYQYGLADNVLPSATIFGGIHCFDKNNFEYSTIFGEIDANGTVGSWLCVRTPNGTSKVLGISQRIDGATTTYDPTPPASDNSTQIATTAWVNTRLGGTNVTSTELGYLDGVTSNIQTQLNSKITTAITKAANGSWKDNKSGLIINWGRFKSPSKQTTFQVSFNRAFASTDYSVAIVDSSGSINSNEYVNSISVTPATTTYFNCIQRLTDLPNYNWIAIGY